MTAAIVSKITHNKRRIQRALWILSLAVIAYAAYDWIAAVLVGLTYIASTVSFPPDR